MKRILLLLILIGFGHKGWEYYRQQSVKPMYDSPYLVVYGRETCGYTKRLVNDLEREGVRFEFASVDDEATADMLHERMAASGFDVRMYNLPVVDLNNSISIRPDNQNLIKEAKALSL